MSNPQDGPSKDLTAKRAGMNYRTYIGIGKEIRILRPITGPDGSPTRRFHPSFDFIHRNALRSELQLHLASLQSHFRG